MANQTFARYAKQTYARSAEQNAKLYATEPETRFAAKSTNLIHPFYERSVRQWLAGVRRHLNAPI